MQALVYHGNRDLRLMNVPDPQPGPGEALLKVDYCGVCATDIEEYVYGPKFLDAKKIPIVTGHEITATVIETPGGVGVPQPGARVALNTVLVCGACFWCRRGQGQQCQEFAVAGFDRDGGLAEYMTWPADELLALPDSVSSESAALVEPSAVARHCARRARLAPGDAVAVVGVGAVGSLTLQIAKAMGAIVFAVDVRRQSLDLAREFGADAVINPLEVDAKATLADLTEGRGPDVVIDAAGGAQTAVDCVSYARRGGRVVLVAIYTQTSKLDFNMLVAEEKEVCGSLAYTRDDVKGAVELMSSGRLRTTPLISDQVSLDDVVDTAFPRMMAPSKDVYRILVKP